MSTEIFGDAAPGFGAVVDVFRSHGDRFHELGGAVCVYVDGRPVVDLWGGSADARTGRPWTEHTPVLSFSVSKGVTALAVHRLSEQGLLDLDRPIAHYWPEFGAHGKAEAPVWWALSHRSAVAYLDAPLTLDEVCATEPVLRAIEAQRPNWNPGDGYAYHAVTYGFILGELVRRVTHQPFGEYFRREFAKPLGLDAWYGVPEDRLADVAVMDVGLLEWSDPAVIETIDRTIATDGRAWRALTLDGALRLPIGSRRDLDYNRPEVLRAQLPAAGLVTTARSLARVYSSAVRSTDGVRTVGDETVRRAIRPRSVGAQVFDFGIPTADGRWGEGVQLPSPLARRMLGPTSFGHDGAAGALGLADLDAGVGFGFVTNRMSVGFDERANGLVAAVAECLGIDVPEPIALAS